MPYDVTLDDVSPLITYTGEWVAADKTSPDIYAARYSGTTFHTSRTTGARASFEFNGTAVYIFGAKRFNHGHYNVTLDGGEVQRFDGHALGVNGEDGVYQVPLYTQTGLANGLHKVVLTNDGTAELPYVDIDMVTWTSNDSQGQNKTIDGSDGGWRYTPSEVWGSGYAGNYYAQTGHSTNASGASASLTFEGTGIYLYGGTLDNHGTFNVQIDNQPPRIGLNGSTPGYHYNIPLFYADGLEPGTHKITVTNTNDGKFLDIDYANIIQPISTKSKTPMIAGIVSGVVVAALLIAGAWFFHRRKKQRHTEPVHPLAKEHEPKLYGLPPVGYGPGCGGPGWVSTMPTLTNTFLPHAGFIQPNPPYETPQGLQSLKQVNTPAPLPRRKAQPGLVQNTRPRGERTGRKLREMRVRVQVQERSQEWGSVSDSSDTEYSEMLPPNYAQAVELRAQRRTKL